MARLSGIVNVYKPAGMTSHDVVNILRKILNMKKIGHTGTLDPDAEGVLPICVGSATKAADMLTASQKEYLARVILGSATDTQDSSGKVIKTADMSKFILSEDDIKAAAEAFVGKSEQIPPMYSAVKVGGKKLYELARRGVEIERKPRPVWIYGIEISDCEPKNGGVKEFSMAVKCSKGTYIRTLCNDLGEKLGCYGHMSRLVRTRSGRFTSEQSHTPEEIARMASRGDMSFLTPTDKIFEEYEPLVLDERAAEMVRNGVRIRAPRNAKEGEIYRIYDSSQNFLTLSKAEGQRLTILKTFFEQRAEDNRKHAKQNLNGEIF